MGSAEKLVDNWGRVHDQLRISVTDRCNLRCLYCMGRQPASYLSRSALLTYEEIIRFVRAVAKLGLRHVRLTGGEPLVRKDLPALVASLAAVEGIEDVSLTTNGSLLSQWASPLKEAGLRRVNISLDCLCPAKYHWLTGGELDSVLKGVDCACRAGFDTIKINAVAIRHFSESEIIPLAEFARRIGAEIRFIELMPSPQDNGSPHFEPLPASEVLAALEAHYGKLVPLEQTSAKSPATVYKFPDGNGLVGIIPALTRPFCATCNRLRLSADGKLRNCLFAFESWDIRALLRRGASEKTLQEIVLAAVNAKWQSRPEPEDKNLRLPMPMYRAGG
ncbi:MAG: GTP 3',8-cyclase MoaA [Thermoguttaceae bacterium]|nr:GTP 3',8-cyclase MoaA [Thermoguttaceae bacterium]MDW8078679.1 GTP 3',8-cyclase MoaA [Thermoguttaceae bacterium]